MRRAASLFVLVAIALVAAPAAATGWHNPPIVKPPIVKPPVVKPPVVKPPVVTPPAAVTPPPGPATPPAAPASSPAQQAAPAAGGKGPGLAGQLAFGFVTGFSWYVVCAAEIERNPTGFFARWFCFPRTGYRPPPTPEHMLPTFAVP